MEKKQPMAMLALIVLIVAALVGLSHTFFVVDQTEQAALMHMGNPLRMITEPGLYVKLPFIQEVVKFDRRLLTSTFGPDEISTKDQKSLVIDCYCQWKIVNPRAFLESVGTNMQAQSRLEDIVRAELRAQVGLYELAEFVSDAQESILKKITEVVREKSAGLGVEILDIRPKRIALSPEYEKRSLDRMKEEGERWARDCRRQGEEEAMKIRAQAEREKKTALAEAYKKAQEIRGDGEARALKICTEAYGQAPDFYAFFRTLEACRNSLKANTTFIFSEDNEFFAYLKGSYGQQKSARKGK